MDGGDYRELVVISMSLFAWLNTKSPHLLTSNPTDEYSHQCSQICRFPLMHICACSHQYSLESKLLGAF